MIAVEALATYCGATLLPSSPLRGKLEAELREIASRGLALDLPLPTFGRFVVSRLDPTVSPESGLAALSIADLHLACACIEGEKPAIDHLVKRASDDVRRVAARFVKIGGAGVDDIAQIVMTRLLVPDGEKPPRLTLYRGQGPLAGFIRVTAARLAINVSQGSSAVDRNAAPADDLFHALVSPRSGPETDAVREDVRSKVREAFSAAVATLSARDRNVLYYSVCDGLSIDVLARMYGVHRATAARWIESARSSLVTATRDALARMLPASGAEMTPAIHEHFSRLELSVARLLRTDDEAR